VTDEELDAVQKTYLDWLSMMPGTYAKNSLAYQLAGDDVPALIAEVRRLRAQNEVARASVRAVGQILDVLKDPNAELMLKDLREMFRGLPVIPQ
jgi:hypothetical protein